MTRGTVLRQQDAPQVLAAAARSAWIDNVRGFAIVLVVLGHVIQFGSHGAFDFFSNPAFIAIYSFHMPLFAAISGFLAHRTFIRRRKTAIMVDRVRSLLVPFIAWTAIFGTAVQYLSQSWNTAGGALGGFLTQLVFPASTLWFLAFLFFAFAVTALALFAERFIGIAALPLSVVVVFLIPMDELLAMNQLRWLYPFFLAGLLTNRFKEYLSRFERPATVISGIVFIALIGFWQRDYSVYISGGQLAAEDPIQSFLIWVYRFVLGTCGVIVVTGLVRMISNRHPMRYLQSLGRASLGIYCVQTYLIFLPRRLSAPSDAVLYSFVYVPLVSVAILIVSYAVTTLVLQRLRIFRVVFLGGR